MLSSSTRLVRRLLAAGATFALTVGLAGAAPAAADPGDDGSQPLPGYTISNPPLAPLDVRGAPSTVRQGVHRHAGYIIEIPPAWNGELVMWAHGYRGQTTVLSPETPNYGLRQRLLEAGTVVGKIVLTVE